MDMKRKIFIAVVGLTLLGSSICISQTNVLKNTVAVVHDSNCEWHHYNEVSPSYEDSGCKEYWICCNHSELGPQFTAPTSGNIVNSTHPSGFVSSLSTDDSRYMAPYGEPLSFEDGQIPSLISKGPNINSLEVIDTDATDGSRCLKASISGSDYGISFSKNYLDKVFANSSIQAIEFDAKGSKASCNFRHRTNGSNVCYEINSNGWGIDTTWKRFSFTRDFYNNHKESGDYMIYGGEYTSGNYLLIDNVRPVTKALNSYGFDNGKFTESLTASKLETYGPSSSIQLFAHSASSGIVTSVGFDYSIKTEGLRSIKYTKANGYMAFFTSSAIRNMLSDTVALSIDVYSTVAANGFTTQNFVDGVNMKSLGQKVANQWETFTITKSQMSSDGRFLILQGSTSGDWYFDNIRFVNVSQNDEEITNLGDIYINNTSDNSVIPTKRNMDSISSIKVDGVDLNYANLVSRDTSSITIKNSVLSAGDHIISIKYLNGGTVYNEKIYLTAIVLTTKSELSASLEYMSNGYYTLSGYSGIYRITCGDVEVPFENSGSNILIPDAALVQLLGESEGKKVNGAVNLCLHAIGTSYCQPINITLTNSVNVKSIPTYNGSGIDTHAYSSTSSYATYTNYEQYFNVDKVREYANTGLKIMYEQAVHVTVSDTTLKPALSYLIGNAQKMGLKVMLSDDALATMSRQTVSLIGNDIVLGSGITKHFNSTSDLDTYVESRLNMYINIPGVYGVSVGDEQSYEMLCNGFGDVFQSIHRVLNKLGRNDFFVNSNLNPMTATSLMLTGVDKTHEPEKDYKIYLEKYLEVTGNNYIQYDAYPLSDNTTTIGGALYTNGVMTTPGYGISNFHFRQLYLSAYIAKQHNVDLYVVTQSFTNGNSRILNASDIAWLNNTLLGLGVKHISYFVYQIRGNTGSEVWENNSAFLTKEGDKNDIYYYYQGQLAQLNAFSPVISSFDFDWVYAYHGSNESQAWAYGGITGSNLKNVITMPSETYGQITAHTVDSDWGLITGLVNSSGTKMYMVQNIHNNFDNQLLQTHTIKFDTKDYNYAVVWENGQARVVKLGTTNETLSYKRKNTLTLKLSSGHAAYFILF